MPQSMEEDADGDALGKMCYSVWVGSIMLVGVTALTAAVCLPNPFAASILLFLASTLFIPLEPIPEWAKQFCKFTIDYCIRYHHFQVAYDDQDSLQPGRPHMIGYEPHSALPMAIPHLLCPFSPARPAAFRDISTLTTSAVFCVPLVRHLFYWLGGRPASKATVRSILARNGACVLIPGGVAEVTEIQHGSEVAFMHSRLGFVKLALEHGASLVPVFAFGQTGCYSWIKPGPPVVPASWVAGFARRIGFMPLIIWGEAFSPLPHPVPVYMAVGAAVELPRRENPSTEEIRQHLGRFIEAMCSLFERHKTAAGHPDLQLRVM